MPFLQLMHSSQASVPVQYWDNTAVRHCGCDFYIWTPVTWLYLYHIFNWVVYFLGTKFFIFLYGWNTSPGQHLSLYCSLAVYLNDAVLCSKEVVQFLEPNLSVDFSAWTIGVLFRKFFLEPMSSRAFPTFFFNKSVYLALCWGLWFIYTRL